MHAVFNPAKIAKRLPFSCGFNPFYPPFYQGGVERINA